MSQRSNSPDSASPRGSVLAETPRPVGGHETPDLAWGEVTPMAGVDGPSPRRSPAPSVSPVFVRTPQSVPSPVGSPIGSPPVPGSTPARRPSQASPVSKHRGFMASPPTPRRPVVAGAGGDPDDGPDNDTGNVLYGTNIEEREVVKEFLRFIMRFRLGGSDEPEPFYIKELHKRWERCTARATKGISFPIDAGHIHAFSPWLYRHVIDFPTEAIPIFDRELWGVSVRELGVERPEEVGPCQVQVHSLLEADCKVMRCVNPHDVDRLMSIKGIVIRCSDVMPDMRTAVFRCAVDECKHEEIVQLSHWQIEVPTRCEVCGTPNSFQIMHNKSVFSDKQVVKLQEPPEVVPDGETPQNVQIVLCDDLVDSVRPGERIEITGIYRAAPVRANRNWKAVSAVYRTFIDAIAIQCEKKGRIEFNSEELSFEQGRPPKLSEEKDLNPDLNTETEIEWNKKVRAMAQERDADGKLTIVGKLIQSFAPSIYEEDEVKKGLLCQLFGGTPKVAGLNSKGRCRPEINSLLCGDPSTAKSQLLSYAFKLAPRGVYTSGKGSSAVGLTASINRDPATGDFVLESGALALSDRGVCCIDEFDKMDDNARAILHEAMEQQTVSVAKAGIVASLNARCSILASANPKESSYDPKLSVVENIHLPKNLMSRFDFIWLMLDKRNKELDARLAAHLVSMYSVSGVQRRIEPSIESELFRRYVSFARRWVFPELTTEAADALVEAYSELRNQAGSREASTATPRQLESLIRISESLAKMELREKVSVEDVREAVRLLKVATYAAAMDPETGIIDMEQLIVGKGAARRKRDKDIEQLLQDVLAEKGADGNTITVDQAKHTISERLTERKEQPVTEAEFNTALRSGEGSGWILRRGRDLEYR